MSNDEIFGVCSRLPTSGTAKFILTIAPFSKPPASTTEIIKRVNVLAKQMAIEIYNGDPEEAFEASLREMNFRVDGHRVDLGMALNINTHASILQEGWADAPVLQELMDHLDKHYRQLPNK